MSKVAKNERLLMRGIAKVLRDRNIEGGKTFEEMSTQYLECQTKEFDIIKTDKHHIWVDLQGLEMDGYAFVHTKMDRNLSDLMVELTHNQLRRYIIRQAFDLTCKIIHSDHPDAVKLCETTYSYRGTNNMSQAEVFTHYEELQKNYRVVEDYMKSIGGNNNAK